MSLLARVLGRGRKMAEEPAARAGDRRPPAVRAAPEPGARGYKGAGCGRDGYIDTPVMWRGSTFQVCGLWPWLLGSNSPRNAALLGRHIDTGEMVCADPLSYFKGGLITQPSLILLGLNGYGKSSLLRRIAACVAAFGAVPLILGDLKGEFVTMIRALGGQVVRLGPGRGCLNLLDIVDVVRVAQRLPRRVRDEVVSHAIANRQDILLSLIQLRRGEPPSETEEIIIAEALAILDERTGETGTPPILRDLVDLIDAAPDRLRKVARDRGEIGRYQDRTDDLLDSLNGVINDGELGPTFNGFTTEKLLVDRPAVIDVSFFEGSPDLRVQGAILTACWGMAMNLVDLTQALADEGVERRIHQLVIMDELWRPMRAAPRMVQRIDSLTRLNRTKGAGTMKCTHTMSDFLALGSEEERQIAVGFLERAGIVLCAALPPREFPMLEQAIDLSRAEQALLESWQLPPTMDPSALDGVTFKDGDRGPEWLGEGWERPAGAQEHTGARKKVHPGVGNFLLKPRGRPGLPFRMTLYPAEETWHETSERWFEPSGEQRNNHHHQEEEPINASTLEREPAS
ncbi:MAG: ATP/GTP-binding protein [Solirubrobacteraceae bacterium]